MRFLASLTGKKGVQSKTAKTEKCKKTSRYRGVQVVANGADCCQAARTISGKRFLSDEVPILPLAECTAETCRCSYELFDDRRTDLRRASDEVYDIRSALYDDDKRSGGSCGRRRTDRH